MKKQTTFLQACIEKLTDGFKLQTIANLLWPKDFNLPQPTMVEMGISKLPLVCWCEVSMGGDNIVKYGAIGGGVCCFVYLWQQTYLHTQIGFSNGYIGAQCAMAT
jgi:hypothetical protein